MIRIGRPLAGANYPAKNGDDADKPARRLGQSESHNLEHEYVE